MSFQYWITWCQLFHYICLDINRRFLEINFRIWIWIVKLLCSATRKYLLPLLCRPPTFEQLVAVCLVTPTHIHDLIPVHSPNVTALIYILYRLNWQTDLSRWIVHSVKRTGIYWIECSSVRIWICIQNVQISSGTGPYFVYISITTLKTHLSIPRYLSSIIHSIFGQIIFIWAQI